MMKKGEKFAALLLGVTFTVLGIINLYGVAVVWGVIGGLYLGMVWFIKTKE